MTFSQTTLETADVAELRRLERECLDPDPLHAAVLGALRLNCSVCGEPTGALLNVLGVWMCLHCRTLLERVAEAENAA